MAVKSHASRARPHTPAPAPAPAPGIRRGPAVYPVVSGGSGAVVAARPTSRPAVCPVCPVGSGGIGPVVCPVVRA